MRGSDSEDLIQSILGAPTFSGFEVGAGEVDPWSDFERAVGASLPAGFRCFVDKYGPGLINSTLYVRHPSLGNPTLIVSTLRLMEAYAEHFSTAGLDFQVGVSKGQLLPFAHMMDGVDLFFLVGDGAEPDWPVCAYVPTDGVVVEFPWGFSDWLARYLMDDEQLDWLSGFGEDEPKTFSDKWAY